jgi:hypothetical protein
MNQLSTTVTPEEIECLASDICVDVSYPVPNVVIRAFDKVAPLNVSSDEDLLLVRAVSAITELAILSKNAMHIGVDYSPINHAFYVTARQTDHNYKDIESSVDLREFVYLSEEDALQQLQTVEDKLIELVGLAKDKAMGAL